MPTSYTDKLSGMLFLLAVDLDHERNNKQTCWLFCDGGVMHRLHQLHDQICDFLLRPNARAFEMARRTLSPQNLERAKLMMTQL